MNRTESSTHEAIATSGARQSGTDTPSISVVVPAHNEAANAAALIDEIRAALDGTVAFEIVWVDDGSDDGMSEGLLADGRDRPFLRVIRHRARAGQSAAIATGIRFARGPVIATLDGDGQNDPADIPRLLAAFENEPDRARLLIAGRREKRRDTWIKRMASRIANAIRARMLGDDTPDTGCGLKIFAREAFLSLPRFDHMHRFLPALMVQAGGRVRSVAVGHRPRRAGRSKYGVLDRLWVGIADLFGVLWLGRRRLAAEAYEEARRGSGAA